MKRLPVLLIALSLATPAFAAGLRVNPFAESNELKDAKAAVEVINKEGEALSRESKYLDQKKSDLDWSTGEIKKLTTRWENERRNLEIEVPRLQQRLNNMESIIQNYNSRCERTFTYPANQGPPPEYYACVNEKARLEPQVSALRTEQSNMEGRIASSNKMGATLKENWKVLEEETMKWAARQKEYNYKVNEWNPRRDAAVARLAAIQKKSDDCDRAIKTDNIEDMKAICGFTFDGNKKKPNPKLKPQKGGLTVTPNKPGK